MTLSCQTITFRPLTCKFQDFILMHIWTAFHFIYVPHFHYSSVAERYLGLFHSLATVTMVVVALNIAEKVSVEQDVKSSGNMPRSHIAESHSKFICSDLRVYWFTEWPHQFIFISTLSEGSSFSTPPALVVSYFVALRHSLWCEMKSQSYFNFYFPDC